MSEARVSETTSAAVTGAGVVLLTLCAGQFLMALDSSVMNVSIATVAEDLGTSITGIQSAIVLYTLVMAMLMVTGGKVGSIIGRKRAFILGLTIYCSGSLPPPSRRTSRCCSSDGRSSKGSGRRSSCRRSWRSWLGTSRLGAGRGHTAWSVPPARSRSPWSLIGGLATTYASWRWVFAGEVLIGIGIFLFSRRVTDAPAETRPHSICSAPFSGLGRWVCSSSAC